MENPRATCLKIHGNLIIYLSGILKSAVLITIKLLKPAVLTGFNYITKNKI